MQQFSELLIIFCVYQYAERRRTGASYPTFSKKRQR